MSVTPTTTTLTVRWESPLDTIDVITAYLLTVTRPATRGDANDVKSDDSDPKGADSESKPPGSDPGTDPTTDPGGDPRSHEPVHACVKAALVWVTERTDVGLWNVLVLRPPRWPSG